MDCIDDIWFSSGGRCCSLVLLARMLCCASTDGAWLKMVPPRAVCGASSPSVDGMVVTARGSGFVSGSDPRRADTDSETADIVAWDKLGPPGANDAGGGWLLSDTGAPAAAAAALLAWEWKLALSC